MDNLRELNGFMGRVIVEINKNSDETLDTIINGMTYRDYIEAYSKIPDRFLDFPVIKTLMTIYELSKLATATPPENEDEAEQFAKEFFKKFGINDIDTMTENEVEDLLSDMDVFMDVVISIGSRES